ncbi:MAG: hypothetical protein K2X94_01900 [Amoebophilaceae bacterium]|nr:hypothetical protein [Amoebophilaceae bacterium]
MNVSWLFVRSILCVVLLWVSGCVRALYKIEDHQECPICLDDSAHMHMPIVCPAGATCSDNKHLVCPHCLIKVFEMYEGLSYLCPTCRVSIDKMKVVHAVIKAGKSDGATLAFIEKSMVAIFEHVAHEFLNYLLRPKNSI